MPADIAELRPYLRDFDFPRLFVEGLGWNHHIAEPVRVQVDACDYSLKPVAEKAGFVVYHCDCGADNNVPQYPIRRKIESAVAQRAYEHLIVFADPGRKAQVWQWVKRESGKPVACREYAVNAGQSGDHVLQRLQRLAFDIEEEATLTVPVVTSRVRAALDAEKVTKRFYERFRSELTAFGNFIDGVIAQGDRDWYASLMLNRTMFVYFVQKQGFLDDDRDYLRNRLNRVRNQGGGRRFQQFYRIFLLRLFHEGLAKHEAQRVPDLAALLGKVPFLNGGLFDVHDLERDNSEISIPDEAFERVFNFFDGYRWHLDERPYREANEINPDVLGYIFEKYINQKQMGAYYTKEDITGYIARSTVIPFLFDVAKKKCPVAFGPDGGVWRLLREDPDRYVYPALSHGITWDTHQAGTPKRLDAPFELPDEIAAGIDDVCRRTSWNSPAPEDYALPAETWREVVARRQRYAEICAHLAAAKAQDVNHLITLNLDIEQFAKDVIAQSEGPELLRAFWHAMSDVSVLDPTCGSGAFLFAALNVLEPLYTACLEGMRGFIDDLERTDRSSSPNALSDFKDVLAQMQKHSSERYFVLKSVVLNNLYGVDIMEEAVEICKLRLFLKLVSQLKRYDQIEPLPDIDFNVRSGNTLVGFTSLDALRHAMSVTPDGNLRALFDEDIATLDRIERRSQIASAAFNKFRQQQTSLGGDATANTKTELRLILDSLRDELDRHLATEYGANPTSSSACDTWRSSHQPFHWFVEFYGIMNTGGFDVVIGNPPYVAMRKLSDYRIRGFRTMHCPDIYAACVERSTLLTSNSARYGMILPISFQFSDVFEDAREAIRTHAREIWVSTFSRNPAALFSAGLGVRSTIFIAHASSYGHPTIFTTRLNRWVEEFRGVLFQTLEYATLPPTLAKSGWTRIGNSRMGDLFGTLLDQGNTLAEGFPIPRHANRSPLRFKTTALYYLSVFVTDPPSYDSLGRAIQHTKVGELNYSTHERQEVAQVLALGKIALMWWAATGDDFDVTASGLGGTPIGYDSFTEAIRSKLRSLSSQIREVMSENVIYTHYAGKWMGNYDVKCVRHLTDLADRLVLDTLGLGEYWEDLELEYLRFLKMTGERPGTTRTVPDFAARR